MSLHNVKAGVLTASDRASRGVYNDESGKLLRERLSAMEGVEVRRYDVVPDKRKAIAACLRRWCDGDALDVILTTGGTGLSPRDVTPEATRGLLDKEIPGLAEALRLEGSGFTPLAWLSRGIAGLRGKTLIVNLPGSPQAVEQSLRVLARLLPHALAMVRGEAHAESGKARRHAF